jgi:hypothetical protein
MGRLCIYLLEGLVRFLGIPVYTLTVYIMIVYVMVVYIMIDFSI